MAYVRWSSDDFKSDVYCYADVNGGYTLHVAGGRYPEGIPEVGNFPSGQDKAKWDEWFVKHKAQQKWLDENHNKIVKIDHPMAGETYRLGSLEDVATKMRELKDAGFVVPEWVFGVIEEEIEDERKVADTGQGVGETT
jgi:hypothetical protein